MGAPNDCGDAAKSRQCTFFNTVHLQPKDIGFEHGGVKLASCPRRHLTLLRPCIELHFHSAKALEHQKNRCNILQSYFPRDLFWPTFWKYSIRTCTTNHNVNVLSFSIPFSPFRHNARLVAKIEAMEFVSKFKLMKVFLSFLAPYSNSEQQH